MPKVLYKKVDAEGIKRTEGSFQFSPITKGVSYSRNQRHLNSYEEKLMKKFRCGYSTLVKSLIAEKYQKEFGELITPFF